MDWVALSMTPAIFARCRDITKQSVPNLQHSPQKSAKAIYGLSCSIKRSMSMIFWKTPWIQRSAGIVYARNATGQCAHLQWKQCSSMMPLSRLSKMACGTWSPVRSQVMWDMVSSAKSSNPPLSKEIFLQERGLADDHWEDQAYGDHDDWGEDNESDEDN